MDNHPYTWRYINYEGEEAAELTKKERNIRQTPVSATVLSVHFVTGDSLCHKKLCIRDN